MLSSARGRHLVDVQRQLKAQQRQPSLAECAALGACVCPPRRASSGCSGWPRLTNARGLCFPLAPRRGLRVERKHGRRGAQHVEGVADSVLFARRSRGTLRRRLAATIAQPGGAGWQVQRGWRPRLPGAAHTFAAQCACKTGHPGAAGTARPARLHCKQTVQPSSCQDHASRTEELGAERCAAQHVVQHTSEQLVCEGALLLSTNTLRSHAASAGERAWRSSGCNAPA